MLRIITSSLRSFFFFCIIYVNFYREKYLLTGELIRVEWNTNGIKIYIWKVTSIYYLVFIKNKHFY